MERETTCDVLKMQFQKDDNNGHFDCVRLYSIYSLIFCIIFLQSMFDEYQVKKCVNEILIIIVSTVWSFFHCGHH